MYYLEVFSLLNKLAVRYLVAGGIAVVLHGVVRLTADLDLMIDLEKENLLKLMEALKILGYKPKLPVNPSDFADPKTRKEWIKKKNMKVFSFIHPKDEYKFIDIFVDEPISFADAYKRRQVIEAKEIGINVLSLDDLIALKKSSGREQDLADIKMLRELKKSHGK